MELRWHRLSPVAIPTSRVMQLALQQRNGIALIRSTVVIELAKRPKATPIVKRSSAEAYNYGYQVGIAQANRDKQEAYNDGHRDRTDWERTATARAFRNGYDAGAAQQAREDSEYP